MDKKRKRISVGWMIDPIVKAALDARLAQEKKENDKTSMNKLVEGLLASTLILSGHLPGDWQPPGELRGKYERK